MPLQWVDLGTAAGAASMAAAIMLLAQLVKLTPLGDRITGATFALIVSLVIYIIGALIIALPLSETLSWGLSWLACAGTAVGIHTAVSNGTSTFVKSPPAT
jgi:hypothetical protein